MYYYHNSIYDYRQVAPLDITIVNHKEDIFFFP